MVFIKLPDVLYDILEAALLIQVYREAERMYDRLSTFSL